MNAAIVLKKHCKSIDQCYECMFRNGEQCALGGHCYPETWKIKEPCRWSGADYAFAVAFRSIDFTNAFRMIGEDVVRVFKENGTNIFAPEGVFTDIKNGETVWLDDIIKEVGNQ